jgi:hypothetical protein
MRASEVSANRQLGLALLVGLGLWVFTGILCPLLAGHLGDPSMRNPYADQMRDACASGDTKAIQGLLRRGADVNAPVWEDTTPLMWATERGRLAAVKVLLAAGADVNAETSHGGTVLNLAESSLAHDDPIIALLERVGARK